MRKSRRRLPRLRIARDGLGRRRLYPASERCATRTTAQSRNRLKEQAFLDLEVRLPAIEDQRRVIPLQGQLNSLRALLAETERDVAALEAALLKRVTED